MFGREWRERLSQLAWCGARCFDSRRRVNRWALLGLLLWNKYGPCEFKVGQFAFIQSTEKVSLVEHIRYRMNRTTGFSLIVIAIGFLPKRG